MSLEFASRILGMVVFAAVGADLGVRASANAIFSFPPETTGFLLALVGILFGLVATPYLTVRPFQAARRLLTDSPVETVLAALIGGVFGLVVGLLLAYPLSLLGGAVGRYAPAVVTLTLAYLGITLFTLRATEIYALLESARGGNRRRAGTGDAGRELLLDTSVLIDGRIVEVAQTGFLGGVLVLPRFVLSELHHVADSSDELRRARGRRGLAKLNELQQDPQIEFRIIDDDIDGLNQVDDKLVALALQREAGVVTNDYNLNRVAQAQGVLVLNVNELANAVRSIYIPGETFAIRVLQEGRENDQGVGYLEDGTMVVVEHGRQYLDRTINVTVTKLINRAAGRMIFAEPSEGGR